MKFELSVIVPTYNEAANVIPLYQEISRNLSNVNFEVVFVDDDSQDGTVENINQLIERYDNVRLIRRLNKRGLSSACIDGFASSNANYFAVIDADLQHDPEVLMTMLDAVHKDDLDIAVASRFANNSTIQGLSATREKISKLGNYIASFITGAKLSDPLSGFFMIHHRILDKIIHKLSGKGFKILLDIFSSCKLSRIKPSYVEIPITFRKRHSGESKLDSLVMLEFLMLLLDKIVGRYIPVRFIMFVLVGLSGLVLHIMLLALMLKFGMFPFSLAQTLATVLVMTSNFFINNAFTYRDQRLKGKKVIGGLLSFYLACSLGAFINITVASFLYNKGIVWVLAGFVGCIIGAVWNYAITSYTTWSNKNV